MDSEYYCFCYSQPTQTSNDDDTVTFDPDLVTRQLKGLMNNDDDDELLSDDDFFSNATSEGTLWVWLPLCFIFGTDEQEEEGLSYMMQQMDKELANTTMAKSFDQIQQEQQQQGEGLKPVDIDFNLVKNLLESYTSQEGGAGPTSNILQSMGIRMPER